MNSHIASILDTVGVTQLELVARSVLENSAAALSGKSVWQEINAVHNDRRTLAIVRCSGSAEVSGKSLDWSCIVKIVDMSVEANVAAAWVDPAIEETVYQLGLLTDTGTPFRPAKCFAVSQPNDHTKLFWLEDLGGAPQPPWTLDEYLSVARHTGEFNGRMVLEPPELPFELPVDVHRARRQVSQPQRLESLASLMEHSSDPLLRTALKDVQVSSVVELSRLWGELHEITPSLPHGMVFGDCHARNLFPLGHETVAVDWAGLALDPIGTDLSVLIGSAFTWGSEEAVMVGQHEPEMFEAYTDGLREAGWAGERNDVRRALFTHMPLYLIGVVLIVESIRSGKAEIRREWIEARVGATFDELPGKLSPVIAMVPGYVEELKQLLQ